MGAKPSLPGDVNGLPRSPIGYQSLTSRSVDHRALLMLGGVHRTDRTSGTWPTCSTSSSSPTTRDHQSPQTVELVAVGAFQKVSKETKLFREALAVHV